jgi:putative PIN family toxin of toxin-antitoxin system
MLKAVLDANIFISSLLNKSGAPARLQDLWKDDEYLLLSSPPIIREIKAVLYLPRIKTKYCLNDFDIQKLLNLIEMEAILVPGITDVGNIIPEDPSDQIFFMCY